MQRNRMGQPLWKIERRYREILCLHDESKAPAFLKYLLASGCSCRDCGELVQTQSKNFCCRKDNGPAN